MLTNNFTGCRPCMHASVQCNFAAVEKCCAHVIKICAGVFSIVRLHACTKYFYSCKTLQHIHNFNLWDFCDKFTYSDICMHFFFTWLWNYLGTWFHKLKILVTLICFHTYISTRTGGVWQKSHKSRMFFCFFAFRPDLSWLIPTQIRLYISWKMTEK